MTSDWVPAWLESLVGHFVKMVKMPDDAEWEVMRARFDEMDHDERWAAVKYLLTGIIVDDITLDKKGKR